MKGSIEDNNYYIKTEIAVRDNGMFYEELYEPHKVILSENSMESGIHI